MAAQKIINYMGPDQVLIDESQYSKYLSLIKELDEANNVLKAVFSALRALGQIRKVDYKMLQLTDYSIRSYNDSVLKLKEKDEKFNTSLISDKEFDMNDDEISMESIFDKAFISLGLGIQQIFEIYDNDINTFIGDVGFHLEKLNKSLFFTLSKWYTTCDKPKVKEQDKLFKKLLKMMGRQLIKLGNNKENLIVKEDKKRMREEKYE